MPSYRVSLFIVYPCLEFQWKRPIELRKQQGIERTKIIWLDRTYVVEGREQWDSGLGSLVSKNIALMANGYDILP